jgi:hypothetical protein
MTNNQKQSVIDGRRAKDKWVGEDDEKVLKAFL